MSIFHVFKQTLFQKIVLLCASIVSPSIFANTDYSALPPPVEVSEPNLLSLTAVAVLALIIAKAIKKK